VLDVKQALEDQEGKWGSSACLPPSLTQVLVWWHDTHANVRACCAGIPSHQQVLCFAGHILNDRLPLADYFMEDYTLSEVVLYLSRRLSHPKRILLTTHAKPSQVSAVHVEADMPVAEVQGLLESRALASAAGGVHTDVVLVKRQDGSTVPVQVDPAEGISHLESKVALREVRCQMIAGSTRSVQPTI
jgi:hypothetical protein